MLAHSTITTIIMTTCNACVVLGLVLLSSTFGCVVGVITNEQAMTYLSQYGYLSNPTKDPNIGNLMSEETVVNAIKEFQSFAGLNSTGRLDNNTLHYMSMPRCGVQDKVKHNPRLGSRIRRHVLRGGKWEMNDLTYNISRYPKQLGKSETDSEIRKAFDVWSKVTPLKFTHEKSGKVNIDIKFLEGEHGDGNPFESSHVMLSRAFFPKYGGSVHFDDSVKWSNNSNEDYSLLPRAVHELGHSLGLDHSSEISSIMSPFVINYCPAFILSSDDVANIQEIYGSNPTAGKSDFDRKTTEFPINN